MILEHSIVGEPISRARFALSADPDGNIDLVRIDEDGDVMDTLATITVMPNRKISLVIQDQMDNMKFNVCEEGFIEVRYR